MCHARSAFVRSTTMRGDHCPLVVSATPWLLTPTGRVNWPAIWNSLR